MFARVITAQVGPDGIAGTTEFVERQLPGIRQLPGFTDYYLLAGTEDGTVVIISLWETREQMDAVTASAGSSGMHDEHDPATGLTDMQLATFDVVRHVSARST